MKYTFFFDYIYYRITKLYFRWDGRTGGTALATITMMQILVAVDVIIFALRVFIDRYALAAYENLTLSCLVLGIIVLMFFNYKKYNGTYNKFRTYWKNESISKRRLKGLIVIVSILLPWIPLIIFSFIG